MNIKEKINIDTKLAGKGIRYDPNFIISDDNFEDFTNRDIQLKDLKNVHATRSRITRSQGKLVWNLFLGPSDHYKCQFSVLTNCGIVTALKSKLDKKQLDLFKNSCFGYFLSLPSVLSQNQLIHGMLLRELVCERDDEIWIKVNNTRLRFGLQEFAIINGLKCTENYNNEFAATEESKLMELYFPEKSKVVLRNIMSTVLEKIILQLPDFKPVDAVMHSVDLPSISKQDCSNSSLDNELALLRSDVKVLTEKVSSMEKFMKSSFELIFRALDIKNESKVGTSIGDNNGDNSNEKNDETPNVGGMGDDQVDDPANVRQQNVVTTFTQSFGENKAMREGRNNQVDSDWSNFTDSKVSKFTQTFHDRKTQKEGDVAVVSQNELDLSEISDAEISKFTQPDKSVATTDTTDLVCDNVRKVDATANDHVKGIEENMVVMSVMLGETPAIPCRLHKPAAVCESPFLSKFDSGCGKVEGQSSKRVGNAHPRNYILSIKHPFVKSITERIDDMKLTLQFNRDCGVYVATFAEYFLDGLEISNYLDDIDAIRIRYGVLLWDYGKKKQRQCAVSEDECTGRLLKKNDGVQQI
ncbi:hypothetical protein FXO37_16662 [Capsicum annuum]|nr:hypothetical protein FXO37_16662 [Capsicum annuum]